MILYAALAVATIATRCNAQSSFDPLRPPAIPLVVRSPYLNTYQQAGSAGGNGGYLAGEWPSFWSGQVTGWEGLIRVDGVIYQWMGASPLIDVFANQTSFEYTSTKSIFTFSVGELVQMRVTFLSPVTPTDMLRSSLPFSYMDIAVVSLDGTPHDVQLYTDISAEWVSGDPAATAQWEYDVVPSNAQPSTDSATKPPSHIAVAPTEPELGTKVVGSLDSETVVAHTWKPNAGYGQGQRPTNFAPANAPQQTDTAGMVNRRQNEEDVGGVAYHKVWRQQQLEFSELNQQANWGFWYYATDNVAGLTHQSGSDEDVRGQFVVEGKLDNTEDTVFRPIDDNWPVFGFSVDLGEVSTEAKSTLFMLSLVQQNCIQFENAEGNVTLPCMWTQYFPSERDAISYFYGDHDETCAITDIFDTKVHDDSVTAGGEDYASLTTLAVRQAFATLAFVNSPDFPLVFMKEISSNGDIQTVDVIFPFHPIAIYTNPDILRYLLDPLFIQQEAGYWPYKFSIHDLGTFPNATGHNDGNAEQQPLEECGNMLTMVLLYYQRTKDRAYLTVHYPILKQWNDYLVEEALIPMDQISTDDFAGSLENQTNLGLKGIIGIQAMAQIANITGNVEDGLNFTKIAHDYIEKWQVLAIAQASGDFTLPHTTLSYGMNDTFGLLYNLFMDKELGLDLVPQSVYDMQSEFYPTVFDEYGVPLDTRHAYTKNDWQIWCAAVASSETRDQFTSTLARWLGETTTNYAFTDLYDAATGGYPPGLNFIARPVVGGMFAYLALEGAPESPVVLPS